MNSATPPPAVKVAPVAQAKQTKPPVAPAPSGATAAPPVISNGISKVHMGSLDDLIADDSMFVSFPALFLCLLYLSRKPHPVDFVFVADWMTCRS
jgi:hypothetical protein